MNWIVLVSIYWNVCLLVEYSYWVRCEGRSAQYPSGEGESWDTAEDEYITDNKGEPRLLEKLELVNTHVSNLIHAFNGTTMFVNDLKTLHNMAEEMKTIHNEITELKYSDFDMKAKLNMTDSEITKAKGIYFETMNKMVKLSEILRSLTN